MSILKYVLNYTKKVQYLILLIILLFLRPPVYNKISTPLLTSYIIILAVILLLHFISKSWKNYFRIDILFIIGFTIVHFQWPIMLSISNVQPVMFEYYKANSYYINYGTWLSVVGMIFWIMGFSSKVRVHKKATGYLLRYKSALITSIIFFVLFIITAGPKYLTGEIYRKGGTGDAITGIGGYILILYMITFFILTVIVMLRFNKKVNNSQFFTRNILYTILLIVSILVFFMAGDRSSALMVISGFFVLYGNLIKPISLKNFLIIGITGAFVLTFVGVIRAQEAGASSNLSLDSIYSVTLNMANSARTLYMGIESIDKLDSFFYGKLWTGNLLGVIPFAQNFYLSMTGEPEYLLNTAGYITFIQLGSNPHTGLGTSFIIDIFLNFGLIGVCLIMFLHGYLFKYVQVNFEQQNNIRWLLFGVVLGATAFYIGRGNILNPIKYIVWGAIIFFLFFKKIKLVST